MTLPTFQPGESLRAEDLNAISRAAGARTVGGQGVTAVFAGVLGALGLQVPGQVDFHLCLLTQVAGGDPDEPQNIRYDFQAIGVPGLKGTNTTPAMGRPTQEPDIPLIRPSKIEIGYVCRFKDSGGGITVLLGVFDEAPAYEICEEEPES